MVLFVLLMVILAVAIVIFVALLSLWRKYKIIYRSYCIACERLREALHDVSKAG